MGQYRQWLHHREVEHRLRSQLAACEQELEQIEEGMRQLENDAAYASNSIMQALIARHTEMMLDKVAMTLEAAGPLVAATYSSTQSAEQPVPVAYTTPAADSSGTGTVSPALNAWSSLPDIAAQDIQAPVTHISPPSSSPSQPSRPSLPHISNGQGNLLPEDVSSFIDAYGLTNPQLKMPWWLRNAVNAAQNARGSSSPVDQQSLRTNRLVQRWFERWGQQIEAVEEEAGK